MEKTKTYNIPLTKDEISDLVNLYHSIIGCIKYSIEQCKKLGNDLTREEKNLEIYNYEYERLNSIYLGLN